MCVSHSVVSDSLWTYGLCSSSGSSIHGILQAGKLEWVFMPFSRGSYWWINAPVFVSSRENSIAWGICHVNFLSTPADWAPVALRRNQFYKKFWLEYSWFLFLNGLPGCAVVKNPPASAGDAGSIPGSGRSPAEGDGNPCQYSCLK